MAPTIAAALWPAMGGTDVPSAGGAWQPEQEAAPEGATAASAPAGAEVASATMASPAMAIPAAFTAIIPV